MFRLLSEDNVSGTLEKIKNVITGVESSTNKATVSFSKLESVMKKTGNEKYFQGTKEAIDGTDAAVEKYNKSLDKAMEKMKSLGAEDSEIQKVRDGMGTLNTKVDEGSQKVSKMSQMWSGFKLAAGAAITGAGYYLADFLKQSAQAAVTIQQQNETIGGAMGLNAIQSVQMGPQFQKTVETIMQKTGRNPQDIRNVMPSVEMVTGGDQARTQAGLEAISALAYIKPGATMDTTSTMYNKMVTSGSPMALGNFGISLTDMGLTTKQFKSMSQDARQSAMDSAIAAKTQNVNANMANTAAGRMAIFQGELTIFEGRIGDDLIPTLTWLLNSITPIFDWVEDTYVNIGPYQVQLTSVMTGIIAAGALLGLLAGPLMALQALGAGSLVTSLWNYVKAIAATGDTSVIAAEEENTANITRLKGSVAALGIIGIAAIGVQELFVQGMTVVNSPEYTSQHPSTVAGGNAFLTEGSNMMNWPGMVAAVGYGLATGTNPWDTTSDINTTLPTTGRENQNLGPLSWLQNWGGVFGKNKTPSPTQGNETGQSGSSGADVGGIAYAADGSRKPTAAQDWASFTDMSRFKWILPNPAPVTDFFNSIPGRISRALSGVPGAIYNWGNNTINNMVKGMLNGIPSFQQALQLYNRTFPT